MGSYFPPSAALQQKPFDPLESYGKQLQLGSLLQGQQLQRQQVQEGALDLEAKRGEMEDQKKITQAYLQAGGDLSVTADLAAQAGVRFQKVEAIRTAGLDHQQKLAALTKDQQVNLKGQMEMVGQQSQAVLALPPEQRPQAIQQGIQQLAQAGAVPPDQAQQLLSSAPFNDPTALETWLKVHSTSALATKDALDRIDKDAEEARKAARAPYDLVAAQSEAQIKAREAKEGPAPTEVGLAVKAAAGDSAAEAALKRLDQSRREGRPINQFSSTPQDVEDTAKAIIDGEATPVLTNYSFRDRTAIEARLKRAGYNQARAEMDFKATSKHLATLNGNQQERLRQSITSASDMLDKIEGLYSEWSQIAPTSGYKILNRAALTAMKNLPGRPGAVANALDAQIADLTADLGNVYMGGNSPTDQSLKLAGQNLKTEWNQESFREALNQARLNLKIRRNSIFNSQPAGVSSGSPYIPPSQQGGQQQNGGNYWDQFPVHK
jgi:hypothetical protein